MLGSVARKLRIFGFDTLYAAHAEDSEILKIGSDQRRLILTADRELFKRAVKARADGVLVDCLSEFDDLVHIFEKAGVESVGSDQIGSRCSLCNGILETVGPDAAQGVLAEKNDLQNTELHQCKSCGKFYWEGSHMLQLRTLARRINSALTKIQRQSLSRDSAPQTS